MGLLEAPMGPVRGLARLGRGLAGSHTRLRWASSLEPLRGLGLAASMSCNLSGAS